MKVDPNLFIILSDAKCTHWTILYINSILLDVCRRIHFNGHEISNLKQGEISQLSSWLPYKQPYHYGGRGYLIWVQSIRFRDALF